MSELRIFSTKPHSLRLIRTRNVAVSAGPAETGGDLCTVVCTRVCVCACVYFLKLYSSKGRSDYVYSAL